MENENLKASRFDMVGPDIMREEPTTDAMPWYERFYPMIKAAFPDAVFNRIEVKGSKKTMVAWTADGHRFVMSWHELDQDEKQWLADNATPRTDGLLD